MPNLLSTNARSHLANKMDRYKIIKEVGDGTFGSVWRAINKLTGEVVAIKKMKKKYYSWEECMRLREVKSLRSMNHPNIVKLKEVIRENDILYFVFEYMDCNLYQLMNSRGPPFSEDEIRNWCFQIFQALGHMHQQGYFHRDLKPENLLVTKEVIKIADFGLAREINSQPPYTEYVSTRWYRAPEVLLQAAAYGAAVDMWAMGAIIAELFTLRPLFPGSSETDEIYKVCNILGTPDHISWPEGIKLAQAIGFRFPQCERIDLHSVVPTASLDAINLILWLCSWNPDRRPTAVEALQHPFFKPCFYTPPPSAHFRSARVAASPPSVGVSGTTAQKSIVRSSVVLTGPKLPKYNSSLNSYSPARAAGAQRKLELDKRVSQASDLNHKLNKSNTTTNQPRTRLLTKGHTGNRPTKDLQQEADLADKLSHLAVRSIGTNKPVADQKDAVSSNRMTKQPAVRATKWHAPSVDPFRRSLDMASVSRGLSPRKLVS